MGNSEVISALPPWRFVVRRLSFLLTAIVCVPKTIMPSEWMRRVWDVESGEDAPEFKDQAQAQRILGLLMRHINDIARRLHQAPDQYEPLLMENPNDRDPVPILDEWCSGFMKFETHAWQQHVGALHLYNLRDKYSCL